MVYTYKECKQKYKTDYEIRKQLESGLLIRVQRGIYTDEVNESDLAIMSKQYPNAVLTLNSAFYYHNLTDTIPQHYYLMTDKNCTKIQNTKVKQFFDNSDSLNIGLMTMQYDGATIRIFNKERMLVELIRNKNSLPYDYYKEIIKNYRDIVDELDIQAIQEYVEKLPKSCFVRRTLQAEFF